MARPKPDDELNFTNEFIEKNDYVILKIIHKPTGKSTEIKNYPNKIKIKLRTITGTIIHIIKNIRLL